MARTGLKTTLPENATKLTTYRQLAEIVGSFVQGHQPLLVILGAPGLAKSQTLKHATKNVHALLVKGHRSPMQFYAACYMAKDQPIIVDDANEFLSEKLNQQFIRSLTETDSFKRLEYDSSAKSFVRLGIPTHFYTKSPVCIISNWWRDDPLFNALESRAEFFNFTPSWPELHREVGTWFWDQQIYDYVAKNIPFLKAPDARLYVKAYNRKKGNLQHLPWQNLIDEAADDEAGQRVRELVHDRKIRTNDARARMFVTEGYGSRATFYRRLSEIMAWLPADESVPRIRLTRSSPPIEPRPQDAYMEPEEDEEVEGDYEDEA